MKTSSSSINELLLKSSILKSEVTTNKQLIKEAKDSIDTAFFEQQKITASVVRKMLNDFMCDNTENNSHYLMSPNESSEFTKYVRRSGASISLEHSQAMDEYNAAKIKLAETFIRELHNASESRLEAFIHQCTLKNINKFRK